MMNELVDRMGTTIEERYNISEGQAGLRRNRSRVDHIYRLGEIVQCGEDASLTTYCLFRNVQKAYDTVVCTNGLWEKLWGMG